MAGRKKARAPRASTGSIHAGAASPEIFRISASSIDRRGHSRVAVALLACCVLTAAGVAAEPSPSATSLPELPPPPSLDAGRPSPVEVEALNARLEKLCSSEAEQRETAAR